eukprot:TRINITY_DN35211_c0_g1_i1.p1 TRINITY_DN35211_c0_g1~~TRINITY_DN35211_c0_g1_i1.p1  ORF type:complete len:128 (+),score=14.75 TRINITY_DN35211_c0_g1_i1:177-560(+)
MVSITLAALSDDFIKTVADQENSIKKGIKGGKWYPYASVEGGTPTIAYGHKLTSSEHSSGKYKDGITDTEAWTLLRQELGQAYSQAQNIFEAQYGKDSFNKCSKELKRYSVQCRSFQKMREVHESDG